ncbi:putative cadmium-transporting ATPase [Sedimentisphaera cyanobacteriorum]|uniref:P-type Zn(2+) transporter n=1 Tax=Sedimentisphaera cyanobacteriorum TaxID=1940790 RepID=A0A1Q2HNE7_9BACT|nr:cation-translocating P-type ATPase [Sedimentisphaera cyanobacteriorum]AQQ08733.1 putative cadmium-transporting ATPase [Sedimentisphaera cyanobacteriorum]
MAHDHLHIEQLEFESQDGLKEAGRVRRVSLALIATLAGGVLLLNSYLSGLPFLYGADSPVVELSAMFGAILLGLPVIIHSVKNIIKGHMHMDELVALAIIAAFATGQYKEAGIVSFFLLLSELMETRTALGARASIESLIKLTPKRAVKLESDGNEKEVKVSELSKDDVIRIRPGDNVAADGEVISGLTSINEATITGESLPVDKVPGMQVFAGTTNLTGGIDVKVTKVGSQTTLGKVQELIMQAEKTKIPIMRIMDKYIKWYIPTILMIAAIAWFFTKHLDRSIAVLVVSCPCALILATPTAMVAAISAAARLGIFVKNVADLEIAGKLSSMVFDKTGTLTTGRLYVTKLEPAEGVEPADLLRTAASAEKMSKHPAARALMGLAKEANVSLQESENFEEVPGKGVQAAVEGSKVLIGRDSFLKDSSIDLSAVSDPALHEEEGFSTLYIAKDGVCMGWIGMQDKTRPEAREAVKKLLDSGLKRITMLTGDRKEVANRVASELGCTDFRASCLPQDKLSIVRKIRDEGHVVAVIGDGINDAPALAEGDLGIAMGAAGSDVAISSASIALMNNDLERLPFLVNLSRKTRTVITQNLLFGSLFIVIGIALTLSGIVSAALAAPLHFVGSLFVIFNSARLVRYGEYFDTHEAVIARDKITDAGEKNNE